MAITEPMKHVPLPPLQSCHMLSPSALLFTAVPYAMVRPSPSSGVLSQPLGHGADPGRVHSLTLPGNKQYLMSHSVSAALQTCLFAVCHGLYPGALHAVCVGLVSITWACDLSLPLLQRQRPVSSCGSGAVLRSPVPSAVLGGVSFVPRATSAALLRQGRRLYAPWPAGGASLRVDLWPARGPWLLQAGAIHCPVQLLLCWPVMDSANSLAVASVHSSRSVPTQDLQLCWRGLRVAAQTHRLACLCAAPLACCPFVSRCCYSSLLLQPVAIQRSWAVWAVVASGLQQALQWSHPGERHLVPTGLTLPACVPL